MAYRTRTSTVSEIEGLIRETREFAAARDWLAYHTPKNLAMAIAGEAGELVAEFQWLSDHEASPQNLTEARLRSITYEMADVLIYLLRLGDVLNVDLAQVVREKLALNEVRFPPHAR